MPAHRRSGCVYFWQPRSRANYGIYGPAFELLENAPRDDVSEEYLNSEKYEIRHWDLSRPDSLAPFIAPVNAIRHANAALQSDWSLIFHTVDNSSSCVTPNALLTIASSLSQISIHVMRKAVGSLWTSMRSTSHRVHPMKCTICCPVPVTNGTACAISCASIRR